jgi:hypothetical protein
VSGVLILVFVFIDLGTMDGGHWVPFSVAAFIGLPSSLWIIILASSIDIQRVREAALDGVYCCSLFGSSCRLDRCLLPDSVISAERFRPFGAA